MPKPWLKLWVEWVHDPKLIGQTLAERGAWGLLLSLAQECEAEGYIVKGDGSPMSVEEIATSLHINKLTDYNALLSMIRRMESLGSLNWDDGCLFITKFAKRQAQLPSDMKEAVRERVKRYRQRQTVTENPLQTPLSSKHSIINNTMCLREGEGNANKPVTFPRKSPISLSSVTENPLQEKKFLPPESLRGTPSLSSVTENPLQEKKFLPLSLFHSQAVTEKPLHEGVFLHYVSLRIIVHKALTEKMGAAIKSALKVYTVEEICQALTNYAQILHGEEYWWTHTWTLEDFLHRGLEKFMDGDVARRTYRIDKGGKHGERKSDDSHRGNVRRTQSPTHEEYLDSLPKKRE